MRRARRGAHHAGHWLPPLTVRPDKDVADIPFASEPAFLGRSGLREPAQHVGACGEQQPGPKIELK